MLLPYSDDSMVINKHQNGIDRFSVKGNITPKKHADLQDYYNLIGNDIFEFSIIISIRHPFERAVSFYFSPHRWQREDLGRYVSETPYWDESLFLQMVEKNNPRPAVEFIKLKKSGVPFYRKAVIHPHQIIRLDSLKKDLCSVVKSLRIPVLNLDNLPHVNVSEGSSLKKHVLTSRELRNFVEEKYREDMIFFQYQPYKIEEYLN